MKQYYCFEVVVDGPITGTSFPLPEAYWNPMEAWRRCELLNMDPTQKHAFMVVMANGMEVSNGNRQPRSDVKGDLRDALFEVR